MPTLGGIGPLILAGSAAVALIILIAAAFRAREEGLTWIAGVLALVPMAFIGWTAALNAMVSPGDRTWFIAIVAFWMATMISTLAALTRLAIKSKKKGLPVAAFLLFPVFGLYVGLLQLGYWAPG